MILVRDTHFRKFNSSLFHLTKTSPLSHRSPSVTRFRLFDQTLLLHPHKAAYWVEAEALLVADLHLGKAAHFRSEGIPVPRMVQQKNYQRLRFLIDHFQPERVFFLGDLFHSFYNRSWQKFIALLAEYPSISFELVLGNHDILADEHYGDAGLIVHEEPYPLPPFLLTHHPFEEIVPDFYYLHGHVHPCVHLHDAGRRSRTRLPCFHFGPHHGILPAFGAFTGMGRVAASAKDRVFVIVEEEVIEV